MDFEENIYYSPEKWGLTPVADIDWSDGDYVFDYRCVWKDANGVFYTARDSGCSCPSPFEDYCDMASLDRLDLTVLEAECRALGDSYSQHRTNAEAMAFLSTVQVAVEAERKSRISLGEALWEKVKQL